MDAWVERELAGVEFADERLRTHLGRLLGDLGERIGGTLPMACQDWAATKAAYRFFDNPRVGDAVILAGHFAATADRFAENVHRADLRDAEKWKACAELLALNPGWTNRDLAAHLHLSEPTVTKYLSPSKCVPEVQAALEAGTLGITDVYTISRAGPDEQRDLLRLKLAGESRDALATRVKRQKAATAQAVRVKRVACPLPSGVSVVAVFGRTGSGKTSSSGKAVAKAVVGLPGSGGLILAAKPEDRAMWEGIFRAAGRADDLLVFGPDEPLRFNFIDAEMAAGGHTRNIVRCITTIGETLRASNNTGGENADFWEAEQARMLHAAVEVVKLAHGTRQTTVG